MFITDGRPLHQVVVTGVNLVNKMESCSSVELLDLLYKECSLAVTIDLLKKKEYPLSQLYPFSNNVRMALSDCVMGNVLGLLRPLKIN